MEKLKDVYWWLAGKKTVTGALFAFVAAGLAALGQDEAAKSLGTIAALLVQIGLLDKAWRATPPSR